MSDTRFPEEERVAYCQNCGRSLNTADVRNVGSAIFCEPCLVAKVAAAERFESAPGSGAAGVGPAAGAYGFSGSSSGVNYNFQGAIPPPAPLINGGPKPGLAALLGFIPGVGAFYNGQYAKGIVHLVVFAVLTSLADHSNGVFGLLVMGWIFYQVIEAHHTARARRDGTPLPNPFGLNDIGERLGFGRAWPAAGVPPGQAGAGAYGSGADGSASAGWSAGSGGGFGGGPSAGAGSQSATAQAPGQAGGAEQAAGPAGSQTAPFQGNWVGGSGRPGPNQAPSSWTPQANYGSYVPPPTASWGTAAETYTSAVPPPWPTDVGHPVSNSTLSRVPIGAIVLIGLGVLFLIGNSGWFHGFPIEKLIPFLLIGVGVWVFLRKMTETGGGLADDGSPTYRLRLFRASRGAIWIVLVGVLFLLDSFNILSWGRSWPLFIIVGGLVTFFERTAYSAAVPPQYGYGPVVPEQPSPVPAPSTSTPASASEDAPAAPRDREEM